MRRFVKYACALVVLGITLLPGAAHAQNYPISSQDATVSDSTPNQCQEITFAYFGGDGQPGSTFNVDLIPNGGSLGTGKFDSNGNFSVRVKIPCTAVAGTKTLRAVGPSRFGSTLTVTSTVFVQAGRLTPTGSNTVPLVLAGVGAIMVGGTFVGLQRRRKTVTA